MQNASRVENFCHGIILLYAKETEKITHRCQLEDDTPDSSGSEEKSSFI